MSWKSWPCTVIVGWNVDIIGALSSHFALTEVIQRIMLYLQMFWRNRRCVGVVPVISSLSNGGERGGCLTEGEHDFPRVTKFLESNFFWLNYPLIIVMLCRTVRTNVLNETKVNISLLVRFIVEGLSILSAGCRNHWKVSAEFRKYNFFIMTMLKRTTSSKTVLHLLRLCYCFV